MEQYNALLDQTGGPLSEIGTSRVISGTIDALVGRYLKSDAFCKGLAPASQTSRRPMLDNFRQCLTPSGRRYGENRIGTMSEGHHRYAGRQDTERAEELVGNLRHLIAFAIAEGECKVDPSAGIKIARGPKSRGHLSWETPQIEQYRERTDSAPTSGWRWN